MYALHTQPHHLCMRLLLGYRDSLGRIVCTRTHRQSAVAATATVNTTLCVLCTISITVAVVADVLFLFFMWRTRLLHRYLYIRDTIVYDIILFHIFVSFYIFKRKIWISNILKLCLMDFILHFFWYQYQYQTWN